MMKLSIKHVGMLLMSGVVLGLASWASAEATTQPAAQVTTPAITVAELQLRANEAMGKNDYATALPLLQKCEQMLSDQPDAVGPIEEEIRVCQKQIKVAAKPIQASVIPAGETRTPHVVPPAGQTLDIPIKELGNFDFDADKGGNIPDDVKQLEGVHFRTSGFMIPLDQAESISEFALVPNVFACCFGGPPQIQHTIVVHCPPGKALSYFPDQLTVEGTLHVREDRSGGFIVSIFEMDATSVRPADK
jgi:hypothetical protein